MSLALNGTLQTAQDGVNHRPIVEITSLPSAGTIPFQGNLFNTDSIPETHSGLIVTSTGALIVPYFTQYDGAADRVYLYYSDEDRIQFTKSGVLANDGYYAHGVAACELADGNIGMVYAYQDIYYTDTRKIKYLICTPTGSIITGSTTIDSSNSAWFRWPTVIKMASGDYLLVYSAGTGEYPTDTAQTHQLYMRTSSNFTSWSAASPITLSGLSANYYKGRPNLSQLSTGRIFLHFDYLNDYQNDVELNNIYSVYSDNDGVSWTTPLKITNFTSLGSGAISATAAVQTNDDITLVYAEKETVRKFDEDTSGYPHSTYTANSVHYDADNDKLYVQCRRGTSSVASYNVPTWEYERYFSTSSSPQLQESVQKDGRSEGKYTVSMGNGYRAMVIDHENDTVTDYVSSTITHFGSWLADPNFKIDHTVTLNKFGISRALINETKLWLICVDGYTGSHVSIGWIDLLEQKDPITGMYTYNEIWYGGAPIRIKLGYHTYEFSYNKAMDWLIITSAHAEFHGGGCGIWLLNTSGNTVAYYCDWNIPQFPEGGAWNAVYMPVQNKIYFSFAYHSGQTDKKGIGEINMEDNSIKYYEPTWYTATDYGLRGIIDIGQDDNGDYRLLMTANLPYPYGGVAIFNVDKHSWVIHNPMTLPGMLDPGDDTWVWCYGGGSATFGKWLSSVAYDPSTKTIFATHSNGNYNTGEFLGVLAFSEVGAYSILDYVEVEDTDVTPSYGAENELTYYNFEYAPNAYYDEDDILWVVWSHFDGSKDELVWNNLIANKQIESYLTDGSKVKIEWDLEKPTKLSFSLASGHIFDPQNLLSTYSVFIRKGRQITIRMGEMISSTEYWHNQGTFVVTESSLSYTPDKHPVIKVKCEDYRVLWEDAEVVATTWYEKASPFTILENVMLVHANLESGDLNINISGHEIDHQFVDVTIEDIVKEVLDHFMYYSFMDVNGIWNPRHLNLNKSVNHYYGSGAEITNFTPDDAYSSFTNRVVVEGMSNIFSEILYNEESIESLNGTMGWWGPEDDIQVWYSEDHTRACRNPRLEIIESISNFDLWKIKGGGGEQISYIDANEHYCIVHITGPNFMALIIGNAALLLSTGIAAISCKTNCGFWIFACSVLSNTLILALGAVANYTYTLWARPVGHEKRTFQAEANDFKLQNELQNRIVTESMEDAFCYTVQSCQTVANNELAVIMAQRNRVKFEKDMHLQDELGDLISISHPYSGETLNILITDLTRTMTIGKSCIDKIEGWRLT